LHANTLFQSWYKKGSTMGQRNVVSVRIELDRETDLAVSRWCSDESRSKRRHISVLLRKLANLRNTHPQELERLGLLDRLPNAA
jgi:hypothetical protein